MIDVAMNNGDLVASSNGDLLLLHTDDDNIIQMCNHAVYTVKDELIFHLGYGNDAWNRRLKISESGFQTVSECAKEAILHGVSEVADVPKISARQGINHNDCLVEYTVFTIDGKSLSSSISINLL